MTQTRLGSLIEALANIAIGFWINFCANLLILPLFGFQITVRDNLVIGVIYTGISLARSYLLRRFFNAQLHKAAQAAAERLAA